MPAKKKAPAKKAAAKKVTARKTARGAMSVAGAATAETVVQLNRAEVQARTKQMLKAELNHTVTDSSKTFPPSVGAEQRKDLQGKVNGTYFGDVNCGVTRSALGDSTTCTAMVSAISAAIPQKHKKNPF